MNVIWEPWLKIGSEEVNDYPLIRKGSWNAQDGCDSRLTIVSQFGELIQIGIYVLKCTSSYPCLPRDVRLNFM